LTYLESTVSVSGRVEVARRFLSVETIALFFWLTGILVLLWRRPPALPDLLLPLWPLSHLLSLARERLYEWRLERWLGGYAFWCIYGALLVVSYTLLAELWPRAVEREQLFLEVLVVFALLHHASRQLFRTFIERRVFGIRYRPERVFGLFAETIPSATDIHKFRAIVVSQLLPQLGILQSALVAGSGESSTLLYWETGETGEKEIDDRSLAGRLEGLSRLENLGAVDRPGLDWLRLLVPLRAGDRVVGSMNYAVIQFIDCGDSCFRKIAHWPPGARGAQQGLGHSFS
jgi:hypothetical protein